jgi:hypothetical protein
VQICLHIFNVKGQWISNFILEELQFYLKQSGKNPLVLKDKVAYATKSYKIPEQDAYLLRKVSPSSYISMYIYTHRRFCDLVVRVPGYISRGPGSIPDAIKFSDK